MFDPKLFEAEVREHLWFLVDEFAFEARPIEIAAPEAWIVFSKSRVEVVAGYEMGSGAFVSLRDTRRGAVRKEYGLHELVQESERAGSYERYKPRVDANLHQQLTALAADLKGAGHEVLNGNFEILRKRHERHRSAVNGPEPGRA